MAEQSATRPKPFPADPTHILETPSKLRPVATEGRPLVLGRFGGRRGAMAPDVASQDPSAGETFPAELARVPPLFLTQFRHPDADHAKKRSNPNGGGKTEERPNRSKGSESFSQKSERQREDRSVKQAKRRNRRKGWKSRAIGRNPKRKGRVLALGINQEGEALHLHCFFLGIKGQIQGYRGTATGQRASEAQKEEPYAEPPRWVRVFFYLRSGLAAGGIRVVYVEVNS